jgi:hypothetical protein
MSKIIEDTGFSSVTDFIVYVLRDVIAMRSEDSSKHLNQSEIDSIRQRLKSLGYL